MSSGRGVKTTSGGGLASIPAASKKMIQSLKEIVNCPELEIYAMLKECNMDPNEAVSRLLSQDPFHEVKSKSEKKKENKDVNELTYSRSRGASSSSNRSGRGWADRYSGRSSTTQYGASDSAASRGKPASKRDNGPTAQAGSTMSMTGNNVNRQPPPLSECYMDKAFPAFTVENTSAAPASSGFQPAWGGMLGQVSMADIVKMGRPSAKASNSLNASQQHSNHHVVSSRMPAPHDLHPSQNRSVKLSESDPDSGVTGSQHVPPSDGWQIEEEPPVASGSSIPELSIDSVSYGNHYDRVEQQYRSPLDDVQFPEDDAGDNVHADVAQSVPVSDQNIQEYNSGGVSGYDNHFYQNINSYQVDHREADHTGASVSSVMENLQNLSLPKEDEDSTSEEDGPAVKIPDHLQVMSADCSHLSFGTFGSGIGGGPFSGSLASRPSKSDEEEVTEAPDAPPVGQPETRNAEEYEDERLETTVDENRMGGNSGNFDATSVSQPDVLKQEAPEVTRENQYSFPSPATDYTFENNQQLSTSFANSQTSSQMQDLPSLLPYSNPLPGILLASNVQQQLREPELAYSPFPISQPTQPKYNNSVSSVSGPTASMAEALKTAGAQPNQSLAGGSVSGGPAPQQHLPVHPYSQPSLMGPFANMILPQSYPILHQSYTYMPSGFQQFSAGNSSYPQSLAAMLPQYKNNVPVTSFPQSVAVAPGYGTLGNSNTIPSNFPLNPPTAPTGTSINYDDVLSSQYKDATHLLSLQQGQTRTMSGVLGGTYYSFQGQGQQQPTAAFRQAQQPTQHYGSLPGYPNFYHSQGGVTLEQLQMSRDGSLGGSQGPQQPKQTPQQLWQNSY